jgi:hypothetical protein
MAQQFAEDFSKLYSKVAEERPVYADIENLLRFFFLAKVIQLNEGAPQAGLNVSPTLKGGFDLSYLLEQYPIKGVSVEKQLRGRSAIKEPENVSLTTQVPMNRPFRVIKAGAVGTSYGFRLLGIIPLANPHSATAQQNLYASVSEPITHKAVTLINQKEDSSTVYFILFSIPKVTLTGDVVEFTEGAQNSR